MKTWVATLLATLLALLLVVAFLPTLLNTSWGQGRLLAFASQRIPGQVAARSIHLSWWNGQKIEGLSLHDPEGKQVASLETLQLDSSLLHLFLRGPSALHFSLNGLNATLIHDAEGTTNFERALGLPSSEEMKQLSPFAIELQNGQGLVQISGLNSPLTLHLTGTTLHDGVEGSFHIDAKLSGFQPDQIHSLKAKISRFPVALLDQFLALREPKLTGLLRLGFGETIDAAIEHQESDSQVHVKGSLSSPSLQADFQGLLTKEAFLLAQPSKIRLALAPQFIDQLIQRELLPASFKTKEVKPIELTIDSLYTPLSPSKELAKMGATLLFDSVKMTLQMSYDHAKGFDAKLSSDPLAIGNATFEGLMFSLKGEDLLLSSRLKAAGMDAFIRLSSSIKSTASGWAMGDVQGVVKTQNVTAKLSAKLLNIQSLAMLHLRGQLDQLIIRNSLVDDLSFLWEIDAAANRIALNLKSETALGEIKVDDWMSKGQMTFEKAHVQANFSFPALPVTQLEKFAMLANVSLHDLRNLAKPGLTKLLGSSVDLKLKADWAGNDPLNRFVDIAIQGGEFSGNASLALGETVSLKEGSPKPSLNITLTPERFKVLREMAFQDGKDNIALANSSVLNLTVATLNVPFSEWQQGTVTADLTLDKLQLLDRNSGERFELSAMKGRLKTDKESQKFHVDLSALDGSWSSRFKSKGNVIEADAQFRQFPASLVCRAFNVDRRARLKLEALLGPVIQADISAQFQDLNGPLKLSAEGKNGQIQLEGALSNGALLLAKPFQLNVAVTPELGEGILQDFVPLLSGLISAEERLRITIDPNGFSMPLNLSNRSAMQVGQMTLELGKMQFSNEGQLGKLLDALKVRDEDVISVWFTPLYLSVANGVITLQRFDMLLMQQYPIAAWGTVDLPGNWIEMAIGLSGRTLKRTVGLTLVDRDYMMQIPLRGKIGAAKLDKGKIAGTLATLVGKMQGTPQGAVLGTVISLATGGGSLLDEKSPPPPTTQPLPWENSQDEQAYNEQESRSDNPVKMLQKGANSLLKNLLR